MSYMFSNMPFLEYAHIDNLDTNKVKNMSNMFSHDDSLFSKFNFYFFKNK